MNPIYVQYYSHTECDCYKIKLPWTIYHSETIVLCKVSEGLEQAKKLALEIIIEHATNVLNTPIKE